MKGFLSGLIVILSVCVGACSGGEEQAPQAQQSPSINTAVVTKQEKVKPVLVPEEQKKPQYRVTGIRDPFQPFARSAQGELSEEQSDIVDPLQKLALSQIDLVGVILGKEKRALIEESSGMGFIIKEGTLIGENSGIVTGIAKDCITVKQHFKDYMGRVNTREVVLSLRKQEGVTGK